MMITMYKPVNPERKDRFLDESLFDHVVEDRVDSEDGDGREGHAQDAVELGRQEREAGLVSGLGKGLALDANSGNLQLWFNLKFFR